jgi:transcription elongation factor GreB
MIVATPKNRYLSRECFERLKTEYQNLLALKTLKANEESSAFIQPGDLRQDYFDFQEDTDRLGLRLTELKEIIEKAKLIRPPSKDQRKKVFLGASVLVEETSGKTKKLKVVDSIEADPLIGHVSVESPLGKALIGRAVNEEITVIGEDDNISYVLKRIEYETS